MKFITREQLHEMIEEEEKSGREYIDPAGSHETEDGYLWSVWKDNRTGLLYAVKEVRNVHMGFNSNEEGKVEELVAIVEREGVCTASWGVTGRTMHLYLARQLADSLPQYEWELNYDSYGCKATKKQS